MTTTPQAALLREAAQSALITLDGISNANPRDKADFETPSEWIAWAKSRARFAADALREPISREVYAERILKQMLREASEPQAEKKCGTCGFIGQEDPVKGCPKCGFDDMRDKLQAALLSDDEIERHFEINKSAPGRELRRLIGRSIEADVLAKLQATQAEPPKHVSMPQYWAVDVFSDGTKIVSIGNDWMSGERQLDELDERTIIGAAQHLLSFVGYGLPPTSFDPDAQAEPAQAGELPDEREALIDDLAKWEAHVRRYDAEGDCNPLGNTLQQARAALSARKPLTTLTRERMEAGRHQIFSTNNPFCPCDSKTFRKVAEWTEREFCRINGIGLEVKP